MVNKGREITEGAVMNIKVTERLLTVLVLLAVLGLLVVVGYPIYKESLPSKVRFGVDKSYSSLPFYVALMDTTRDYFAIEKVEAELIDIVGDPMEGVKNGLYDVAVVPWYWLMISPSTNGDTLRAFGSLEMRSGRSLDALIVPPKSKITRLRDLSGKRIGYIVRDEYLLQLMISKMAVEMNLRNIQYVPIEPEQIITALENDMVDVLFLLDPYRAYMLHVGNSVLAEGMVSAYVMPSVPYGAVVMRDKYVKSENRLAAIRIKAAVEATLGYLARNPEIAKRYVMKVSALPEEEELMMNMRTPEFERLAEINVKSIENFQTDLVKRGIGTCGIKPSEFLFQKTDFVR
jgi:ABC-type nitrate/sulfonate/bicarbonate transport system substrate-binding protein